jgi:glycosyltransferase involved in cell wall biosynthesis
MELTDRGPRGREDTIGMPEKRRKRILFIIQSMTGGGSEKVLILLLRSFDRSRFEPIVLMTRGGGVFLRELPPDVAIYDLKASRSRNTVFQLVHRVWKLRPDAIFSMAFDLTVLLAVVRPLLPWRLRFIARQNINMTALVDVEGFGTFRRLVRIFYPKVDLIICQTDEMLDDLADNFGIDRRRLIRIYNPIDRKAVEAAASGPSPYAGPGPHLVCAGRLNHQKGFDALLRAIAILRRRSIISELTILGEGEEEQALRQLAQDLEITSSVHFLGFQSNPYIYFKHADAFVLSSRYEGLSNAMLEAASLATPIVAVDVPGGVQEVLCGSNAAWIAPKHDAEDLADAIAHCLRELPRVKASVVRHPMIEDMECGMIARCYEEALCSCLPA